MALTEDTAIAAARKLLDTQNNERMQLDPLRLYVTGKQAMPIVVPRDAPQEVRELARISRINMIAIVVQAIVESLFVDNLRMPAGDDGSEPDDSPARAVWRAWQANKFDRGQSGLYRAAITYGWAYAVYTAGTPVPVIRGLSPRQMTALYAAGEPWPEMALERRGNDRYRVYDATNVVDLDFSGKDKTFQVTRIAQHGANHCPVVRYTASEDLDVEDEPLPETFDTRNRMTSTITSGEVSPLMTMQDQLDVTTFGLLSAQWYTAFRQRWIKGWTPESRTEKLKMGASQVWTFEDAPDDVALGEFGETTLEGFLRSREMTLKYGATLSQTPVHELIGELVNLSAEALAAAEAGRDRKIGLIKVTFGESTEQLAQGVGDLMNVDVPDDLEVVWRDTSARAFGAIVDGLGKLAQMLGVPPEELWDRIPGVTRQDTERWKATRAEGDAVAGLTATLDRQAAPAVPQPGETRTGSGLILPPGARG